MKFPKLISPCPIREAVAEVRFTPSVPPDAVFGIVYQTLKSQYGDAKALPILSLPSDLRNSDKDLAYQPHYALQNDTTTLLIGPRTIAVGMRGDYPGWPVLSKLVQDNMNSFHGTGIVKETHRFGLRYINFFNFDIFVKLLLQVSVNGESWDKDETHFKTIFRNANCAHMVQISKGIIWIGNPPERGSTIDIDSFTENTSGDFVSRFSAFLDVAHTAEKKLFFSLLKPEFLATLNPTYENE